MADELLGLYYPDGSFKSDSEIRRQLALENPPEPVLVTPRQDIRKNLQYWTARTIQAQNAYMETQETNNYCEIVLPETSLLTFQADLHIGASTTCYDRMQQEAELIVNTPNSYLIIVGDLINAFYFNPAQFEDINQTPEQIEYARAYVKYVADAGRLLAVWTGNHDQWVKKMGFNPFRYILEGIKYL